MTEKGDEKYLSKKPVRRIDTFYHNTAENATHCSRAGKTAFVGLQYILDIEKKE